MKFSILKVLLPCSLGLFIFNLLNGHSVMVMLFGLSSLAMALASYAFVEGKLFQHQVTSIPVLNYLAKKNPEICNKQSDRSLFVFIFTAALILSCFSSVLFFSNDVNSFILILGSIFFSLILALFLVVREKRLDA